MRLLLDTVAFLWALECPERISGPALSALGNRKAIREISVISISEIAIKLAVGKLGLVKSDVLDGLADLRLNVLSFTAQHASCLFDLALHHRDPFDRQIIAQALSEDIPVVTSDRSFQLYKGLKVIW